MDDFLSGAVNGGAPMDDYTGDAFLRGAARGGPAGERRLIAALDAAAARAADAADSADEDAFAASVGRIRAIVGALGDADGPHGVALLREMLFAVGNDDLQGVAARALARRLGPDATADLLLALSTAANAGYRRDLLSALAHAGNSGPAGPGAPA